MEERDTWLCTICSEPPAITDGLNVPSVPITDKIPTRAPYRVSFAESQEIQRQLIELLDKGHIRPSMNPFGSPILLVKRRISQCVFVLIIVSSTNSPSKINTLFLGLTSCLINYFMPRCFPRLIYSQVVIRSVFVTVMNTKPPFVQSMDKHRQQSELNEDDMVLLYVAPHRYKTIKSVFPKLRPRETKL